MTRITVESIHVYPVKGMRGVRLEKCAITETGFANDRRFMVVDADGAFVSQRTHPMLARLQPRLVGGHIEIESDDGAVRTFVPVVTDGTRAQVTIRREAMEAMVQADEANRALSGFLEMPVELVWLPETTRRPSHGQIGEGSALTAFSDGYPFLLTSAESLAVVNGWINQALGPEIPMDRFRPNIVVRGCERPFEEEEWTEFSVGTEASFYGMKRCGRCSVIAVDQATGERGDPLPRKVLNARRRFGREACFGMNLNHRGPGIVRVGDAIRVDRRATPVEPNRRLSV